MQTTKYEAYISLRDRLNDLIRRINVQSAEVCAYVQDKRVNVYIPYCSNGSNGDELLNELARAIKDNSKLLLDCMVRNMQSKIAKAKSEAKAEAQHILDTDLTEGQHL